MTGTGRQSTIRSLFGVGMFAWFVGFFILLMPFYLRVTTPLDARLSKDLFFSCMIFFSLILFGMKSERIPKLLAVLFGIISFLSFFNQYDQYSFRVLFQWVFLNTGMIFLLQTISNLDKGGIKIILNFIAITALGQAFWVFTNFFGANPYEWIFTALFPKVRFLDHGAFSEGKIKIAAFTGMVAGSLSNSNLTGWYLSMTAPALFRGKWHWGLIPLAAATIICQSSAGIIALFSILGIYVFSRKFPIKKIMMVFAGLFLVFGGSLVAIRPKKLMADNDRYATWKATVKWVENDLEKGVGLGVFGDYFGLVHIKKLPQLFRQVHNEYLETLVAFGFIGLSILAVIGIRIWLLLDESKVIPFLGILATAINSIVGFPIHISSCALIFIIFSAMMFYKEGEGQWRFHRQG
jgi:hypothetical protein